MLGAVPSAYSASTWATLTRSMRVAPLFQQTLGGLKVGVDRRLAAHGFDEFFGNLYHRNAEEEPEKPRLPDRRGGPAVASGLVAARRHPLLGHRHRHRRGRSPLRSGGQAARQRHRSAQPQAHGDHRRRDNGSVSTGLDTRVLTLVPFVAFQTDYLAV